MGRRKLPKTNVASTAGKSRTKPKPKPNPKGRARGTTKRFSTPDSLEPESDIEKPEPEMTETTENKTNNVP